MLHTVTFSLLVVGGINWLLIGLLEFNLVMFIGGFLGSAGGMFSKVVYILVGLSAVYEIVQHKKLCRMCSASAPM